MADEVIVARDRRAVVGRALADDTTLQGLTTSPYVVRRDYLAAHPDPLAIVTIELSAPGEGPLGWNGGIVERYVIDAFVDPKACGPTQDPTDLVDRICAAVDQALKAASLAAALTAESLTGVAAVAKRTVEWQDVPEPGPEQTRHKSADFEVQFTRLN